MTHINSSKKKNISLLLALLLAMILTLALSGTKADAASIKAPTGLKVSSQTNTKINLKWNKVKGADGYQLSVREYDAFMYRDIVTHKKTISKGSTISCTYKPEHNGIYNKFYAKIRAYKKTSTGKKVYSKWSKEICIKHLFVFAYKFQGSEFKGNCFQYYGADEVPGITCVLNIGGYTYTTKGSRKIYINRYFSNGIKYSFYLKKGKLTSPTYTGYYSRY